MFSLIGWQESKAGTTGYVALAAVPDQHVRVVTPDIFVPAMNQIIGTLVCGGTIADEAYFDSPSLRRLGLLDIAPVFAAVSPNTLTAYRPHPKSPIVLEPDEGVRLYLMETTTTSEIRTAAMILSDGPVEPVNGEMFTIKTTATITSVTGAWVNGGLTFRQTLPVGTYQIVGARCSCATGVAFRLVPVGAQHRPGGQCVNAVGTPDVPEQRYGGMGVWCEFNSMTPPTLEIIAGTAAAQSPELYLDLIQIG